MENVHDESIKSDNLSERILYKLQELIVNKELKPGEYLPSEKELSERFGVGKSSVREAIKMLQVLGVVQSRQGKGTYVRDNISSNIFTSLQFSLLLQQNTPEELLEFRKMYETAFMEMAAKKASAEDKGSIEELYKKFENKFYAGVLTVYDDLEFHKAILMTTKNPFIVKIGDMIFEMLRPSFENSKYYSKERALTDHKAILEAFLSSDPGGVNKSVHQTLDTSYKKMLDIKGE